MILRGGREPNYERRHVREALASMETVIASSPTIQAASIVIDCSHGNSRKVYTNQPIVCANVVS